MYCPRSLLIVVTHALQGGRMCQHTRWGEGHNANTGPFRVTNHPICPGLRGFTGLGTFSAEPRKCRWQTRTLSRGPVSPVGRPVVTCSEEKDHVFKGYCSPGLVQPYHCVLWVRHLPSLCPNSALSDLRDQSTSQECSSSTMSLFWICGCFHHLRTGKVQ